MQSSLTSYPTGRGYLYLKKICLIWLLALWRCSLLVNCQISDCRDVNFNPIACLPGPENIAKGRPIAITPNRTTCGSPASGYCRPKPRNGCYMCNSSNPSQSHGPENMINLNDPAKGFWDLGMKPTWWQSITWWDAKHRGLLTDNTIKVNVTFSFNKRYLISGNMIVTFYSAKPKAAVIERSTDFGKTWKPYAYFADNCQTRFATPIPTKLSATSVNNFQAYCEQSTSTGAEQGAEIAFNPMAPFVTSNFWDPNIQQHIQATHIRIRLEYPWTDGNHIFQEQQFLNQYYYDITNVHINGRCDCNGHGQACIGNLDALVCRCVHNTEGVDCERCLPLYNNRTWMPATSPTQINPCQKCECNNHAVRCNFNSTLGFGVCQDCSHNTTGFFCQQCQERFYRNLSQPMNSQQACSSCDCYAFGIRNNGTCAQVGTSNVTIGQCDCKSNFRGRRCDQCNDGHYGVTLPPVGECKACNCSNIGSVNGSITCHQITGQCNCKASINGRTCSFCKDGYHSFPNVTNGECQACICDIGGAFSSVCNKASGDCSCRPNIIGRSCDAPANGYFVPSFDFMKTEAETSSNAISTINGYGSAYTGFGFARLSGSNQIITYFAPPFTSRYTFVIRYKQEGNQSIELSAVFHYINNSVSVLLKSSNFTLPARNRTASFSYHHQEATELLGGGNYSVTLSLVNASMGNISLDVDSLVLLWDFASSRFYQNANDTLKNATRACWEARQSILTNPAESATCKAITFSVNSELFNGSLACDCNPTGTLNNTFCDKNGGQCQCKPGVGGRKCDQCRPGFFKFSNEGCSACNCTVLGSKSLVCDIATGQCPCKPGVINRTCSGCRTSFFGYQTGLGCRNCSCNWDGSAVVFCDENGVCPCKSTTMGTKCNQCKPLHFNFTSNGCMPCNCDPSGSTNLQCDLQSGNCSCKRDTQGLKCDTCKAGFYGLQSGNENGCQSCFCFNKTRQCRDAQGFYAITIQSQFTNQTDQWRLINSSGLVATYLNTSSGLRFDATDRFLISLRAPSKFLGNKLSSYAQTLSVQFITTSSLANSEAQLTLFIKHLDGSRASFRLPVNRTSRQQTAIFRLQEAPTIERLTVNRLQHVLTSIAEMTIQFNTSRIASVTVQSVQLVSASNSIVSPQLANYIENCSCPVNFTGNSCESCASGYTREFSNNGSYTNCKPCECNSRSTSCNPQTGICSNCRIGTEGDYCERCQPNVLGPDCTRCIAGFYGLNDTSYPGCRPCNCVLLNTNGYNSTTCNQVTGQCDCRPNIGGRTCDRCAENAVNTTTIGCQTCSECYRLIQVEVQTLRRDILNITNSLASARSTIQLGQSPSFGTRLTTLSSSVSALTINARNSSTIESGLAAELAMLNFSLDAMQKTLSQNVSGGINDTQAAMRVINGTRSQITRLHNEIYQLLWASNHVLQHDVSGKVNATGQLRNDLDIVNRNISALWSGYSARLAQTGQLLNETLFLSGSAVTATAAGISRSNDTLRLVNASRLLLEQHRNTLVTLQSSFTTIQSNLSVVMDDITRLSTQANETLRNASSLNTTPDQRLVELRSRYDKLRSNLTSLDRALLSANVTYGTLVRDLAVFQASSLSSQRSLNQSEIELRSLALQARNAETTATNAINSATSVLREAQDTLRIMQNFNTTSRNAETMADRSLRSTNEVNATSLRAIAYTESISTDVTSAMKIAADSLALARNGSFSVGNLSSTLEILANNSRKLQREASGSLYTDNYFVNLRRSVSNTSTVVVTPRSNECRNYTSQGEQSARNAAQSLTTARNLQTEVVSKQAEIDSVVRSFQQLSRLNATSLGELRTKLQENQQRFNSSNVKTMVASLRVDVASQEAALRGWRGSVAMLRNEISNIKKTVDELTTLQGCT